MKSLSRLGRGWQNVTVLGSDPSRLADIPTSLGGSWRWAVPIQGEKIVTCVPDDWNGAVCHHHHHRGQPSSAVGIEPGHV